MITENDLASTSIVHSSGISGRATYKIVLKRRAIASGASTGAVTIPMILHEPNSVSESGAPINEAPIDNATIIATRRGKMSAINVAIRGITIRIPASTPYESIAPDEMKVCGVSHRCTIQTAERIIREENLGNTRGRQIMMHARTREGFGPINIRYPAAKIDTRILHTAVRLFNRKRSIHTMQPAKTCKCIPDKASTWAEPLSIASSRRD